MTTTRRSVLSKAIGAGMLTSVAGLSSVLLGSGNALADDRRDERRDEKRYPKIRASLDALRDARAELANAGDDFRGRKETAMKAVDEAIRQLEALVAERP
jgi:hypothetical protein